MTLAETIRADLEKAGLPVGEGPDPAVVAVEATSTSGSWTTYVWAREEQQQVVVHGVLPWPVQEPVRDDMAAFLTLANYGLLVGNFELSRDDGELRFKTSMDYAGIEQLPLQLVRNLVASNLRSMERYMPGLAAVADGADPQAAVAAVESAEQR